MSKLDVIIAMKASNVRCSGKHQCGQNSLLLFFADCNRSRADWSPKI